MLVYAGYFGGTGYDVPTGIAVDRDGNVWLTGTTRSTIERPQAQAPYQETAPGGTDVFVAKLSIQPSGQASLLYWTYLGGVNGDYGGPIAVDDAGNVYLAGSTYSTDFPVTANALQSTNHDNLDAFVAKLNPQADGKASLVYGSYFGGTEYDIATALTVDRRRQHNRDGLYSLERYHFDCSRNFFGLPTGWLGRLRSQSRPRRRRGGGAAVGYVLRRVQHRRR